jgi:hypothetical protein
MKKTKNIFLKNNAIWPNNNTRAPLKWSKMQYRHLPFFILKNTSGKNKYFFPVDGV